MDAATSKAADLYWKQNRHSTRTGERSENSQAAMNNRYTVVPYSTFWAFGVEKMDGLGG